MGKLNLYFSHVIPWKYKQCLFSPPEMCIEWPIIGACRPGHTWALPGLFRIIHTYITGTGCEDTWSPAYSISVHRLCIAYSVVTKYAFCNCASNVAQPSLAQVPTQLCRCLCGQFSKVTATIKLFMFATDNAGKCIFFSISGGTDSKTNYIRTNS